MPISVSCPTCNAILRIPDTAAGKKIKCPKCVASIVVAKPKAPPPEEEPDRRNVPVELPGEPHAPERV